jgi:hypothetical protein
VAERLRVRGIYDGGARRLVRIALAGTADKRPAEPLVRHEVAPRDDTNGCSTNEPGAGKI